MILDTGLLTLISASNEILIWIQILLVRLRMTSNAVILGFSHSDEYCFRLDGQLIIESQIIRIC